LKCNTWVSISEGLVGGQEVEAFAWGVVVALDRSLEVLGGQGGEVGFAREVATHAADGVFDAAFLPRFVGVAEESGEAETLSEQVMLGELGPVIESDGLAQGRRQRFKYLQEAFEDGLGGLIGLAGEAKKTRGAFVNGEDSLAVFAEEHEIGFPVTGHGAVLRLRWTIVNRDAVLEVIDGTASAKAEVTAA
jgi:hypothetical protein